MNPKAAIIGDGGWGTALSMVLLANGYRVAVWGPFPDYLDAVRATLENTFYLPGIRIPPEVEWVPDRAEAVANARIAVLAVPSRFFRPVVASFRGLLPVDCRIVSVAKGFDEQTRCRMSQVAQEALGVETVAALSGPSFADEVARRVPTAVTVAATDADLRDALQAAFNNRRFRVYTSDDVVGVELGGALKNVIALAVGVSDGLGFGDNTRAALITRGLAEMGRLGCALGARASTFSGLSGMGDLIATCTSRLSRNRGVGERLGRGEKIDRILDGMKQVAEGVWNCSLARALARASSVDAPITEEVCAIVRDGKRPDDAVESLMGRDAKPE